MTTIVASTAHKSIACDLQFTKGNHKFKGSSKILSLEGSVPQNMFGVDKCFIGFAGNTSAWGTIVSFFALGAEGNPPKCKNIEFLMLTDKNHIHHSMDLRNWMYIPEKHFAIGSGSDFAIGAMAAGSTPKEAVMLASKHDTHTGLGCKVYSI